MNQIVEKIQQQAVGLPPVFQMELLNYALYLDYKFREQHTSPISANQRREKLANALEEAAVLNPFADIKDAATWQRLQRQDRMLPNRD